MNKEFYDSLFLKKIKNTEESGNIENSLAYFGKQNIPKNFKILDIGTNIGTLPSKLYIEGYKNVSGIDVSNESIGYGKNKYPFLSSNLMSFDGKKIPFEDESFDVVLMFDVIEHVPEVDSFIKKEVSRVLKKGGIFIFQTPNKYINILWVYGSTLNLRLKWWEEHCSLQTPKSLHKILSQSFFDEIKIEKFNILSGYNIKKVKNKMGVIGVLILKLVSYFPLSLYPNIFGYAKK